jgi:hypothetical protein
MAIKITVGKFEIQVESIAEATALLRAMDMDSGKTVRSPSSTRSKPPEGSKKHDELRTIYEFLAAIKAGGPNGATSKVVAHALGVKEKGIGSRLTWIRTMLNGLRFDDKDVFSRVKIPGEGRFWRPEDKFDAAFEAVREAIG